MTPLPTDRPVVRFRFPVRKRTWMDGLSLDPSLRGERERFYPVRKRTGFDRFFDEQAAEMTPDMVALCKRVYSAQEMFCRMGVKSAGYAHPEFAEPGEPR